MKGERSGALWGRGIAFAPLMAVVAVFALAMGFARIVDYGTEELSPPRTDIEALLPDLPPAPATPPTAVAPPPAPARLDPIVDELRARMAWILSAMVLLIAMAIAVVYAWELARSALESFGARSRSWMGAGLSILIALGVLVWLRNTVMLPHVLQVLVDDLSTPVKHVREASKGLTVVSVGSMLLALTALLLPSAREPALVAGKVRALRSWLYVAAGLLVAGVLEIAFLMHWPVARLDAADAASVAKLSDMVTTGAGTILTLVLVLTYGIAAWILNARAASLAAGMEPERRIEWLKEQGFGSTLGQQLVRVIAMLAPLVAGGPLTAFLESLA